MNTLRSLFDRLRNFFSSERSNTQSILDKLNDSGSSGRVSLTRAEMATYSRIQASYGTSVTASTLEQPLDNLDTHAAEIGAYGTGTKVTRDSVYLDDLGNLCPKCAASAPRNSPYDPADNKMTIYDSFFDLSEAFQLYSLAHEGGHSILGLTDELGPAALSLIPAHPQDIFQSARGARGYRGPGRDFARDNGISNHNDQYICAIGIITC